MSHFKVVLSSIFAANLAILLLQASATAETLYIAAATDTAPGGGTFTGFYSPQINSTGNVLFRASCTGLSYLGLFEFDAAKNYPIFQIARPGEIVTNGGTIHYISQYEGAGLASDGSVIFGADYEPSTYPYGIYYGVYSGTDIATLNRVVSTGQPAPLVGDPDPQHTSGTLIPGNLLVAPSGIGTFISDQGIYSVFHNSVTALARTGSGSPFTHVDSGYWTPRINDSGIAVFHGTTSSGSGLYMSNGVSIALNGQAAPTQTGGNSGYFAISGSPPVDLNAVGDVAFKITTSGGQSGDTGIFLYDHGEGVACVARSGDSDGHGSYLISFGEPRINNSGAVVFFANSHDASTRIYLKVSDELFDIPGSSNIGDLSDNPVLNNNGQVLFRNSGHLYLADKYQSISVVQTSGIGTLMDPIDAEGTCLNDYGQVAYAVNGSGSYLALFAPDLHWRQAGDGNWGDAVNWTVGIQPALVHPVIIDPAQSVTITGTSSAVEIKSLSISASGANTATLDLSAGGSLTVSGTAGTNIGAGGIVSLSSGLFTSTVLSIAGGQLTTSGGSLGVGSTLTVTSGGQFSLSGSAAATVGTLAVNSGTVAHSGGSLTISGTAGTAIGAAGVLNLGGGTLATMALAINGGQFNHTSGCLNTTSTSAALVVNGGSLTYSGGSLAIASNQITVTGGTATLNADTSGNATGLLNVWAGGSSTVNFGSSVQHLASLTLTSGTHASINAVGTGYTSRTVKTNALSIDTTSLLDVRDNNVIIDYTNDQTGNQLQAIINMIKSGGGTKTDAAHYDWNGTRGITSSSITGNGGTTYTNKNLSLGIRDFGFDLVNRPAPASVEGVTVESSTANGGTASIVVKYTWIGDMDLDGQVTVNDYLEFLFYYGTPPSDSDYRTWMTGDFNYDGAINVNDYLLLMAGYANQGSPLSSGEEITDAMWQTGMDIVTTTPEPATLLLLASGSLLLLRRRRTT